MQEVVVVPTPPQPAAATSAAETATPATTETPQPVGSDAILPPSDGLAGFAASFVLLPRVRLSSLTPNFTVALPFPREVERWAAVAADRPPTGRPSTAAAPPRARAPRARVPLPTEELPVPAPAPTQAPGGASAPPAGGTAGSVAGFGTGAPSAALPLYYLSQRPVEALLPDGKKVTLALDRPG